MEPSPILIEPCPICHRLFCLEPHDAETRRLWSALKKKLLKIGGQRVIWLLKEPRLADLLERGRLFRGRVMRQAGKQSACHANSAKLWEKDAIHTRICTGYGLNDDGIWRQHTWVRRNGIMLETTVKRERYFGIILSDLEALKFWLSNFPRAIKSFGKLVERFPHLRGVLDPVIKSLVTQ